MEAAAAENEEAAAGRADCARDDASILEANSEATVVAAAAPAPGGAGSADAEVEDTVAAVEEVEEVEEEVAVHQQ